MATIGLALQLRDYRLTVAEILYHMPDHPGLLQSFIWQDLDVAPHYPVLHRFLSFWQARLDGKLHSVTLATVGVIGPARYRGIDAELTLH